uniref:Nitrilase n=1 Tax=Phaffia rhodozyma TaxID=264483 RepID=A0A1I9Q719_PHARH|nr:nitrilase [Phaffia rhodozyma]
MKIKVSVAQCGTAGYDVDKTLDRMEGYVQEAKAVGSQLVLFPEAFVGGYPKFESFGAVVGTRSATGRQTFAAYHKAAITIPGPANTRIEDIARRSGVFIITGLIEKDGGTLYCVVGFYSPTEGLVYKRRKLMPTASEKLIWGFGDGSTISAVTHTFPSAAAEVDVGAVDGPAAQAPTLASNSESSPVVIGSAICWENMMPLLRQHFWNQGVQIHCTPTVDGRENWQSTIKHLAMEG